MWGGADGWFAAAALARIDSSAEWRGGTASRTRSAPRELACSLPAAAESDVSALRPAPRPAHRPQAARTARAEPAVARRAAAAWKVETRSAAARAAPPASVQAAAEA